MSKVVVMDHPLIAHKIGIIRRKETGTREFRDMVSEIGALITYEATKDLKLQDVEIETPICKTNVKELAGKKLAVIPILRAGLGMVEGVLTMIPSAKVGHIGLYRNEETLEPVEYYCKIPKDCSERDVFVVDPMLATGGSDAEEPRRKEYAFPVRYRSSGRRKEAAGGTPGHRYLHRSTGRASE